MDPAETMTIDFDLVGSDMKPRRVNHQELSDWQHGPNMVEYINQLSRQGWQIIGGRGPANIILQRR